ncbi:hypothetical protein [Bradyrhizobium niftali]|uniref:Uncharacterized protein n=1 Tax=Bradyrhizobium niftali TaxID=2560055 RepID=A0A4Y9LRX2_9BRAD|nr:hypothetical protein [Bradyrhizobium niftali]TFV44512.1 hypothetical protein E4K65_27945 [Bradyrhizobium niftali]
MNRTVIMRQLLAFVIAVGVALSPLTMPFSSVSIAAQDEATVAMTSAELADDMPCCPKKAPSPFDCQKCLLATCMMKYSQPTLANGCAEVPQLASVIPLGNDALPAELDQAPPDHPPRANI